VESGGSALALGDDLVGLTFQCDEPPSARECKRVVGIALLVAACRVVPVVGDLAAVFVLTGGEVRSPSRCSTSWPA
jgi:hypothetical protein